jgi:hypothetical protein
MDSKNNTAAAPKRPYSEDSYDSDEQPISFLRRKQKKSTKFKKPKKSKKPKKPKGEETAAEENAEEPKLPLELRQVGPFASDYHGSADEAILSLREGDETVAAFLLPNETAPDPNEAANESIKFHQSTSHHLTPVAFARLRKLGETVASDMRNGIFTAKSNLKGVPYIEMDNTYGSARTHEFHKALAGIYKAIEPSYSVHPDRRWHRNQERPTKDALKKLKFSAYKFHREGQCHKRNGVGSLAFICVSEGHRSVVTIRGPQPGGTVDWEKAKASDVDPATHKIILWDFRVPKGFQVIILLQQNCWHGLAPYGQSIGSYAGFQTPAEYQRIKAKFADLQREATFLDQHVPFLREPSQSTGQRFTWEEVMPICIVMGAPFPLYGSCKVNVMDGADKSCRNLPGPMSLFKQKPRLDSNGEPCIGPNGQPKRMLCNPSFRPDGTVAHTDPDYRRQVEELGIRIHDDCWAEEFPLWVNCPLQMHNTYGADYLMRIGLIPRNSTL